MNNDEKVKAWQDKIIDTFIGKSGYSGERVLDLEAHEKKFISPKIIGNLKGFFYIMDAFIDFLIETFKTASKKTKISWSKNGPLFFCIQLFSFWRMRASYIIFRKGYYIDAVSLLRGIYENVLLLEALKKDVIEVDEVFGKLKIEDSKDLSEKQINDLIKKFNNETNSRIKNYFIGQNSKVSEKSKKLIKSMERTMHTSVHKSQLTLIYYYSDWVKGEKNLPIFPEYDEKLATTYTNICTFISWMFLKTIPHFLLTTEDFGKDWKHKFKVLDDSLREMIENFPKSTGKAVIELVDLKFTVSNL